MDRDEDLAGPPLEDARDASAAVDMKLGKLAPVTRRGLLVGAAVSAVVFPSNASSSQASVQWDEAGQGTATISYLGVSRKLQGSDFGPEATLARDPAEMLEKKYLKISNSRFPGTTIEANGQIIVFKSEGMWQIAFHFGEIGMRQTLLLADWLMDLTFPSVKSSGSGHGVSSALAALSNAFPFGTIQLSKTATFGLRKATPSNGYAGSRFENVFQFDDEAQQIQIGPKDARLLARRLNFYWLQSPSDDGPIGQANAIALATIRANVGSGPVTVVRTIGSLDVAGDITIGKTAKSTTLKVTGAISRNAVFVYAGKSKATYRLAAAFSLEGQLMFLPKSGEDKALWPELPLASAFYRIAFEGDKQSTALIGDAPDKATLIASGHVHLTVSKRGDHEVASTEGGKVKAFRYSAVLHNAYVPLHHADYSRFDFRDTCVQFSLQEHADHEPHKTADFVYILGDAPVFGGMLDRRSVLRVHRASDLLDLKFGFRRLYLESRPDEAEIEDCTKKIASVAVVNADDPLLVVHFPPQHIAEKAFLRVGAECNVPKEENRVPLDKHRIYQNSDQADFAETLKFPETNLKANQQQARKERDKDHDVSIHEMNEIFDHLVEARAAGETRIVFEFPRNENCSADCVSVRGAEPVLPLAFSLDALTQWSRLRTKVATRALGRNVALKAQLDVAGIEPTTPLVGKMAAIRASLARHGAPTDDETSIEFPYRLQLSPSADARWITSPSPDHEAIERGVPLFRARLDPVYGGRDVRAIWSPDFAANYETFFHDDVSERKHPQHSNLAPWLPAGKYWRQFQIGPFVKWRRSYAYPFRMSQDARDRYELVMLSSVYGLPSLLPVPAADLSDPLTPKKLDNDQKSGDPSILPLPSAYTTAIGPYGREGVYSPRPLQRIDITLGSLGANVDLEGQWDPPSGFLSDAYHSTPLWPALTVERWKHRAFQGRDLQVEIVYKGFVLPFGHRCSVIKATERKFYADPAQPNGTSVAYLTQRFFILVGRPVKSFPALGQPFGGRALPYTGVRIVTTRSPDIADPFANDFKTEYPNAVPRAEKLGASAFIPTGANGQWIQFEYVLQYPDGSESDRMAMPFVVADNTLVHDPIAVSELIAFYNKESGSGTTGPYLQPEARTATARGQRLRYAPSRDTGDTEFRTESWLFGVHSRDIGTDTGSPPQRAFVMDATMEGADQPPFYPAIATANVEIQSLNTMNGKSSGFTRVSHDRHFLEHGFTPGRNDAEMYLAVLGNTHLALQDRANASGAIATPNNKVVSVSRLRGPVGGSAEKIATTRETLVTIPLRSTAVATAQAKGAVPLTSSTTAFEYQLPASHQNKFDPLEFFGKALSQAKLFGIVPLKDVVRALSFVDGAPEMLERITYTLFDFTEQAKSTAIGVVSRLRVSMESGLSATEDQIKLYGTSISPTLELTGNDLYPGLFGALRRLIADLATLEATILSFDASQPAEAQNRDAVVADTGAVAKASRDFVAEIEKVADQPTPAIVHNLVGAIQDGIKGLAAEVKSVVEDLKTELAAEIQAFFTVELCIQEDAKPIEIVENLAEEFSVISPVFGFFWENFVPPAPNNGQSCVTINLLDGESRRRAQNALYYETVGKPILDGSAALESLKDKLTEGALAIDTAVKELPRQILSAAQNWLDGMLSLHRLLGLADKLKATGTENLWDKVIVPVLKGGLLPFIDPLLKKTEEIATRAERINTQLLKLVEQAAKLLKGNKLPPAYLPRIQQVSSTLAKAQKALAAALVEHQTLSHLIRKNFFNTTVAYTSNINGYLAPLRARYDQNAQLALIGLQELIARFIAEKDHIFRASRDALEAGLECVNLVGVIENATRSSRQASLAGVAAMALAPLANADADIAALRGIAAQALSDVGRLTKLLLAFDLYECLGKPNETICLAPFQNLFSDANDFYRGAFAKAEGIATKNKDLVDNIEKAAAQLGQATDTVQMVDRVKVLAGRTDEAIAYVFGEERYLVGLLAQGFAFYHKVGDPKSILDPVRNKAYGALRPGLLRAVDLILSLHTGARSLYDKLRSLFLSVPDEQKDILRLFLSPEFFQLLDGSDTAIQAAFDSEKADLDRIRADISTGSGVAGIEPLQKLVEGWLDRTRKPAALAAIDPIANVLDVILTGKISNLIDLKGLKNAVEDALLSFIPRDIGFDYGWSTTLDPFPSESTKLFWIEDETFYKRPPEKGSLVADYIDKKNKAPQSGAKSKHDLVIVSKAGIRIDALDQPPKPYFQVESEIFSPSINLFSSNFDIVTIRLEHIRFKADERGTDLDVKVRSSTAQGQAGVEFGQVVSYIAKLAEVFPSFVPPWLDILFDPPGVVAKFGFPAFSVSIGNMSILNLAVSVQVEVPFDNRPIVGRFMISERDRPFLISFAPYGGGGYLALKTQATSIIGFELQLEFGAVVGVNFGPLRGFGLVAAGIYIEKEKGKDIIIAGFVRAIGEATLGCFAIGLHIEVRVTQQGDDVKGKATFSYSFKVGFAKFRFSFTADYQFAGGRSDGSQSSAAMGLGPSTNGAIPAPGCGANVSKLIVDVPDRYTQWRRYRANFAL